MVLVQGYCLAEENPFHLKEEFTVMDKIEENLFSTMKKELIKDAVCPTKVTIDFKERGETSSVSIDKRLTLQPSPSPAKAQKEKLIKIEKVNNIQKKYDLEAGKIKKQAMDRALAAQKKREVQRLRKSMSLENWTQDKVVDIDLIKERKLYQQKLEREYKKAILEVGKD
jgi:hypothetical protein